MGSSTSTLNSNVLERMATSAMANTIVSCNTDAENIIEVSGGLDGCTINQNAVGTINCSGVSNVEERFKSEMLAQVANKSVMNPPSIFAGEIGMFTQSTSDISEVVNAITNSDISNAFTTTDGTVNKITFDSCKDSVITQGAKSMIKDAKFVSNVQQQFNTSIEAKATNTSSITSSLGNLLTAIILVAVILVILYFVYLMIKNRKSGVSGGSGSGSTTNVYVDGKKENLKSKSKSKIAETSL